MELEVYPKLAEDEDCEFPERDNCNYDDKIERCPHMKYDGSKSIDDSSRWFCKFKREKIQNGKTK